MTARLHLFGQRFGRLTVHGMEMRNTRSYWRCHCDCGNETMVMGKHLVRGATKSCGCIVREMKTIHGHLAGGKKTTEYRAWMSMRHRCLNPRDLDFASYGGRGIKICERWRRRGGFANFISDIGRKPKGRFSLDRYPNNDGDYEPGNVRWATDKQQANNRRVRTKYMRDSLGRFLRY